MANRPVPPAARPAASLLALALGLVLAMPAVAEQLPVDSGPAAQADAQAVPDNEAVADASSQSDAKAGSDVPSQGAAAAGALTLPGAGSADPAVSTLSTPPATDAPPVADAPAAGVDAEPVESEATVPGPAIDEPPVDGAPATDAEADFDELYGDATTGETPPAAYDPWERYNRKMHRFNNAVDRRVARPLAQAYVRAVPAPVRSTVTNFFSNLGQPASAVNALLQGKPKQAAHSAGRFLLNSTLGIGGLFDPATAAKLQNRSEDFGQTLGVWGWRRSRYVELPLFGPRTMRDVLGMAGDAPLSPLRQVDAGAVRVPLQGLQLVDMRMQLLSTDALREGVEDDYALVRDAWSQRRDYQISGDRDADAVPEYLRDDPTVVPVGAMPVPLPVPGG